MPTFAARLIDSSAYALASNFTLKFRKYCNHSGHRAPGRSREVERLGERDERDAELAKLFERENEIRKRSSPAIESPDDDRVDVASSRRLHELLALRSMLRARLHLVNLENDAPFAMVGVLAHLSKLHRNRVLVRRRDARVERDAKGALPLAKTLPRGGSRNAGLLGGSASRFRRGHNL